MKYCIVPVTHYQQNCSVVWCESTLEAAIVDPGGDIDLILGQIERFKLKPVKIILTHGHLDHVGGTAALSKAINVPVIGPHRDDLFWISALKEQAQMMGFSEANLFQPNEWLQHGDTVHIGEVVLDVIHCPGHTPGHVVFVNKQAKVAFVGDVLFNGSIGRTDFPKGNHEDLIRSIREGLFPLGDDIRFIPGHGPESTFGVERQHNPFVSDTRFG